VCRATEHRSRGRLRRDYHVSTPDFQLTPRFALSETEDSAQSFDVTFRMSPDAPLPDAVATGAEPFLSCLRAAAWGLTGGSPPRAVTLPGTFEIR